MAKGTISIMALASRLADIRGLLALAIGRDVDDDSLDELDAVHELIDERDRLRLELDLVGPVEECAKAYTEGLREERDRLRNQVNNLKASLLNLVEENTILRNSLADSAFTPGATMTIEWVEVSYDEAQRAWAAGARVQWGQVGPWQDRQGRLVTRWWDCRVGEMLPWLPYRVPASVGWEATDA